MNSAASVERRIATMLAEEALVRAPEGALAIVLERVDATSQRRRTWPSPGRVVPRIDSRRRLIVALVAALLIAGIAVAGALLVRPPDPAKDLSSLLIVEHQPYDASAPPQPINVLAIAPDASQRKLATIQPNQLPGTYSEWYSDVSVDGRLVLPVSLEGGASTFAVIDLRDPTAPALTPDAEGAMAKFGPDGRVAMSQNDGRIAVFDPRSMVTTRVRVPSTVSLLERDFGPGWSTDGGILVTTGTMPGSNAGGIGRLDPDDGATSDDARPYYAGLGARRVDGSGRSLRCDPSTDDPCDGPTTLRAVGKDGVRTVWTQTDTSVRVIDFAWAVDGGIWILTETTAAGPRLVVLHHVLPDGEMKQVVSLTGSADDPDPNAYSPAGSIAALPMDDAHVIVQLFDQSSRALWSIDPRAHVSTRLPDGVVAGWLFPTALTSPRPTVEQAHALPQAIQGEWAGDNVMLRVGSRVIDIPAVGTLGPTTATSRADGSLAIIGSAEGCPVSTATYHWSFEEPTLRLESLDDQCPARVSLLQGAFQRSLAHPDTGPAIAEPKRSYVVKDFSVPFRVEAPSEQGMRTYIESYRTDFITLHPIAGGTDMNLTFIVPQEGLLDPCDTRDGARTPFGGRRVGAYLANLRDVTLEPAGSVDIAGEETPLVRVASADPRCSEAVALFWTGGRSFHPYSVEPSTRIAIVERGNVDVVILMSRGEGTGRGERWVRELLGSIEWQ